MKKIISVIMTILIVMSSANIAFGDIRITGKTENIPYSETPVGIHKRLQVKGANLIDKSGKKFQIQGISTHGINWDVGKPYVNYQSFQNLRDEWGVNCIRIAMYTQEYNGYCVTDERGKKDLLETIDSAVKYTKKLGMYIIIDWHVLSDQNPLKYKKEAKEFFRLMSKKYGKYKNVIFEICNEPNGATTWNDIKVYAKSVIKIIRKNAKKSIIIVGTPTWSQDVDVASISPIRNVKNVMYAFHFYAATHQEYYMEKVEKAIDNKLPILCTEFSGCEASGSGKIDKVSLYKWLNYFKSNGIGYCCWSLSNKNESASLLKSNCFKKYGYKKSDLSEMGKLITNYYNK